ncbi:Cytosolic carboxypeptidase 6 [Strongyloides ratti]|uniref:Cytosolic carboxypeptidase 6 n=1 Tax=Strongyloides ratti TaxID=34506 RepID=A0A090LLQ9_STRRB|nr:Cytosolic carboxypeptidase 6 [Strongyloides ratti]CEF70735.1 Cytosolic carboxypeptidase 6 [Strongyloides ratti]
MITGEPGNLIFNSQFEGGNLGRIDIINNNEYDLFIRPDTYNDKQRVWFHFEVRNALPNQKVIFNFRNLSKKNVLLKKGVASPVVKEPGSDVWKRLKSSKIFYTENSLTTNSKVTTNVLTIYYQFKNENSYQFAYCIPYTYSKLQKFLHEKEIMFHNIFRKQVIGKSIYQNNLDLVTITNNVNNIQKKQKIVIVTARVHPGETPSSHAMHGLINYLCSNEMEAVELRNEYVFKIIPMLNPDGVVLGNYRSDCLGHDLNRQYVEPNYWSTSTIYCVKNLVRQYSNDPNVELQFCIDIHAHSQKTNSFCIGNIVSKDPKNCDNQLIFPYMLAEGSSEYSLSNTVFDMDDRKEGTFRRVLGSIVPDTCFVYTYEISYFSFNELDEGDTSPCISYSQNDFENCGKNICLAIYKYNQFKCHKRSITIDRPFESFLGSRTLNEFKKLGKVLSKKKKSLEK